MMEILAESIRSMSEGILCGDANRIATALRHVCTAVSCGGHDDLIEVVEEGAKALSDKREFSFDVAKCFLTIAAKIACDSPEREDYLLKAIAVSDQIDDPKKRVSILAQCFGYAAPTNIVKRLAARKVVGMAKKEDELFATMMSELQRIATRGEVGIRTRESACQEYLRGLIFVDEHQACELFLANPVSDYPDGYKRAISRKRLSIVQNMSGLGSKIAQLIDIIHSPSSDTAARESGTKIYEHCKRTTSPEEMLERFCTLIGWNRFPVENKWHCAIAWLSEIRDCAQRVPGESFKREKLTIAACKALNAYDDLRGVGADGKNMREVFQERLSKIINMVISSVEALPVADQKNEWGKIVNISDQHGLRYRSNAGEFCSFSIRDVVERRIVEGNSQNATQEREDIRRATDAFFSAVRPKGGANVAADSGGDKPAPNR